MHRSISKRLLPFSLASGLALTAMMILSGCGQEEIKTYRVAKEKEASPEAAPSPSAAQPIMAQPAASAPAKVQWKLPPGWEEQEPGQMRVGYFTIRKNGQQAQVTIIPLGGPAGGDLDNVNRWRGQVGLAPIKADDLAKQTETVPIDNTTGTLYDIVGTPPEEKEPTRLLAAILPREGTTWFFKMMGADALVQQEKPAFKEFLKTITFQPGEPAKPALAAVAASNAAAPATSASEAASATTWQVPAGWQSQAPGNMQFAKFAILGAGNGKAEVTVAVFPGDVGGTFANINRWRGQLKLPPVDAAGMAGLTNALDLGATKATLVDMANDQNNNRLIAAIVPQDGRSWFFKLTGDKTTVGKEKEAFVNFLKSFKPPAQ